VVGGRQGATGFDGARLRALRQEAKLSQRQLGALVGVHNTVIANYENGRAAPRVDRLGQLAVALDVSPIDLLPPYDDQVESLERLRVRAGLLQAEVAERAGMTRTKYAAIERGQTGTISAADAEALATILKVDLEQVRTAQAVARSTFLERVEMRHGSA
jgi:transcriptional regulator with XRE-family HTH domain